MPSVPGLRRRRRVRRRLAGGGDRADPHRVPAPPRGRVGDAGEDLRGRAAGTATSARCRRAARASRSSSGSPRSRTTRRAGCRWWPARCSSRAPRPASCSRSSTAPASPRCAPGAAAAVSARRPGARGRGSVGVIGCGVNGAWAARCLAAAGYGAGVCFDPRADVAEALAGELGWRTGTARRGGRAGRGGDRDARRGAGRPRRGPATPASTTRRSAPTRTGRRRSSGRRSPRCRLFCDEWEQASKGGELSGAVSRASVERAAVTELGAVLAGDAAGPRGRRRDHALRLDRARDPGPRDCARRARRPPGAARSRRRRSSSEAP